MPKHTDGEWYYDNGAFVKSRNATQPIAALWGANSHEEIVANARLIAAAPEMYDLLDNIAFYINESGKLYAQFPQELLTYAERIRELQKRIEGEETAQWLFTEDDDGKKFFPCSKCGYSPVLFHAKKGWCMECCIDYTRTDYCYTKDEAIKKWKEMQKND